MKRKEAEEEKMALTECIFCFLYRLKRATPFQSSEQIMLPQIKL